MIKGQSSNDFVGQRGFTLIEVLVAMALSAILMLAIYVMFDSVTDVAVSTRKQAGRASGIWMLEGILFDDLRSIYVGKGSPFQFKGKGGSSLGANDMLMGFCTTTSLADAADGPSLSLQRVEYFFRKQGAVGTLYRREKGYCGLDGNWPWVTVPLLKGIATLQLDYYDPKDHTFRSEWSGDDNRYPTLVRMKIVGEDGRERLFGIELSAMAAKGV